MNQQKFISSRNKRQTGEVREHPEQKTRETHSNKKTCGGAKPLSWLASKIAPYLSPLLAAILAEFFVSGTEKYKSGHFFSDWIGFVNECFEFFSYGWELVEHSNLIDEKKKLRASEKARKE